jgi:hypothetical protein
VSESLAVTRCAVHFGRAAHDRCPVCSRPRCDDDALEYGERGCAACLAASNRRRALTPLESLLSGAQVIVPVAVVGGWIYSQYVEVHVFSWLVPALIGIAGASFGAWRRRAPYLRQPAVVGAVTALLGTAFGFRLFPHGPHDPLHPWHEVGFPYLCAVVAAALWPLVLGPPRRSAEREIVSSWPAP